MKKVFLIMVLAVLGVFIGISLNFFFKESIYGQKDYQKNNSALVYKINYQDLSEEEKKN